MPAPYVYPQVVPAGQSAPFAVVTETDHRAWIYITAFLGISLTLLSTAIRVFIRAGTKSGWGHDDAALGVSTILSLAQSSLVIAASSYGLGSSLLTTGVSLDKTQKLYYASNLLYVLSLGTSRISVGIFLRRLTPISSHILILRTLLVTELAWVIGALIAVALQCDARHPWHLGRTCAQSWLNTWEGVEIPGAFFEVATFAIAIGMLVWNIQMPWNKRAVVTTVFGIRMVVMIVALSFRLASFDKVGFASDPTLHEAAFICWTQAEMNLSIIAATVPIVHRFLMTLITNYGGAGGRNLSTSIYLSQTQSRMSRISRRQDSEATTAVAKPGSMQSIPSEGNKKDGEEEEEEERIGDVEGRNSECFIMRPRADGRYSYGIRSNAGMTDDGDAIERCSSVGSGESRRGMVRNDGVERVDYGIAM